MTQRDFRSMPVIAMVMVLAWLLAHCSSESGRGKPNTFITKSGGLSTSGGGGNGGIGRPIDAEIQYALFSRDAESSEFKKPSEHLWQVVCTDIGFTSAVASGLTVSVSKSSEACAVRLLEFTYDGVRYAPADGVGLASGEAYEVALYQDSTGTKKLLVAALQTAKVIADHGVYSVEHRIAADGPMFLTGLEFESSVETQGSASLAAVPMSIQKIQLAIARSQPTVPEVRVQFQCAAAVHTAGKCGDFSFAQMSMVPKLAEGVTKLSLNGERGISVSEWHSAPFVRGSGMTYAYDPREASALRQALKIADPAMAMGLEISANGTWSRHFFRLIQSSATFTSTLVLANTDIPSPISSVRLESYAAAGIPAGYRDAMVNAHVRSPITAHDCTGTYSLAAGAGIDLSRASVQLNSAAVEQMGLALNGDLVRTAANLQVPFKLAKVISGREFRHIFSVSGVDRLLTGVPSLQANWTLSGCDLSGPSAEGLSLLGDMGGSSNIPGSCNGARICINGAPEDKLLGDEEEGTFRGNNVTQLILTASKEGASKFSKWQYKVGPSATTDCFADGDGEYQEVANVGTSVHLDLTSEGLDVLSRLPADKKIAVCARGVLTPSNVVQQVPTRYVWTYAPAPAKKVDVRLVAVSAINNPLNTADGACGPINYGQGPAVPENLQDADSIDDLSKVKNLLTEVRANEPFYIVIYARTSDAAGLGGGAIDMTFSENMIAKRSPAASEAQPAKCAANKATFLNQGPEVMIASRAAYSWCQASFATSPRDCQYMSAEESGIFQNAGSDTFLRLTNFNTDIHGSRAGKWVRYAWISMTPKTNGGAKFAAKPATGGNSNFVSLAAGTFHSYGADEIDWPYLFVPGPAGAATELMVDAGTDKTNQEAATFEQESIVWGGMTPYASITWASTVRPTGVNAGDVSYSIKSQTPFTDGGVEKLRIITEFTVPNDKAGNYTFELTVTDVNVPATTKSDSFVYGKVLPLMVDAGPDRSGNQRSVQQTGTATGGVTPYAEVRWTWTNQGALDAGDVTIAGGSTLTPNFTIKDAAYGDYEFELYVRDAAGVAKTDRFLLKYVNLVVEAGQSTTATSLNFAPNGAAVTGGTAPYTYAWSFLPGAGQVAGDLVITGGTTLTASFAIQNNKTGEFRLRLSATDAAGVSGFDEFTYTRQSLTVDAGTDVAQNLPIYSRVAGHVVVRLNGQVLNDLQDYNLQWALTSGEPQDLQSIDGATTATPTFTVRRAGAYTFILTVSAKNLPALTANDAMVFTVNAQSLVFDPGTNKWANAPFNNVDSSHDMSIGVAPFSYAWSYSGAGDDPANPGTVQFSAPTNAGAQNWHKRIAVEPATAQGKYTVALQVFDSIYNTALPKSYQLIWDTEAPTVDMGDICAASRQFELMAVVSDNFEADGSIDWSTATWTTSGNSSQITVTPTSGSGNQARAQVNIMVDGQYAVTFTIKDKAGNSAEHTVQVAYTESGLIVEAGPDMAARVQAILAGARVLSPIGAPICTATSVLWTVEEEAHSDRAIFDTADMVNPRISWADPTLFDDPLNPGKKYPKGAFDGVYTLTLTATDAAGRESSDSLIFIWDTVVTSHTFYIHEGLKAGELDHGLPPQGGTGLNWTAAEFTDTTEGVNRLPDPIARTEKREIFIQIDNSTDLIGLTQVAIVELDAASQPPFGEDPNRCATANNYVPITGESTSGWFPPIPYTIASAGLGTKTICIRLKDFLGNEGHYTWTERIELVADESTLNVSEFPCRATPRTLQLVEIANEEELRAAMSNNLGSSGRYYRLTNDIVLTSDWQPEALYESVFDGNGKTISGMRMGAVCCDTEVDRAGFFSTVENSIVKDLTLRDFDINGGYTGTGELQVVGILAAEASHAFFQNINLDALAGNRVVGDLVIGGLVGRIVDAEPILSKCDAKQGSRISDIEWSDILAQSYADAPKWGVIAGASKELSPVEGGACTDATKVCLLAPTADMSPSAQAVGQNLSNGAPSVQLPMVGAIE